MRRLLCRIPFFSLAVLSVVVCLAQDIDRRPPWDAIKAVTFNQGNAADSSWLLQSPTVSSGATFPASYTVCDFDGTTNAEITYPDLADFESAPFTVCLWVRLDAAISARVNIIGKNDNSGNYPGWYIHFSPLSSFGYLFATVTNQATAYKVIYSNSAGVADDDDGVWRHIAVTCSDINSYGVFYVNGVAQSMTQGAAGTVTTIASARPLTLAGLNSSNAHSNRMDGQLDDVRIYNTVKTANEIAAIYAEGLGVSRP